MSSATDRIHAVIAPQIHALGMDVEDVTFSNSGNRRVLTVSIDKDGGIGVDDIADASGEVSRILDETDVLGSDPYTLEVTSRGVDQPLTQPRHWRRNWGRLVSIQTQQGQKIRGRIHSSDDTTASVDVKGHRENIELCRVSNAHIEVEFNRKDS